MALKIILKLKGTAAPHLYLDQIKQLIKSDESMHPMMKNALKLMKKAKVPYIQLALVKEIIFIPEKFLHLERALEPTITGYARIEWSDEEKEDYKKDSKLFLENVLNLFKKLGYDFYDKEELSEEKANELLESIKGKKK